MKRITVLSLIILTAICLLSTCFAAHQLPTSDQRLPAEKRILIVYLSRTNNTKAIAEIIHQKVGGRMVALELEHLIPLTTTQLFNKSSARMTLTICRL